jgi:hypothetical protein
VLDEGIAPLFAAGVYLQPRQLGAQSYCVVHDRACGSRNTTGLHNAQKHIVSLFTVPPRRDINPDAILAQLLEPAGVGTPHTTCR